MEVWVLVIKLNGGRSGWPEKAKGERLKIKTILKVVGAAIAAYLVWIVTFRFFRGIGRPSIKFEAGKVEVKNPSPKKPEVTNEEIDKELEKLR